MSAVHVYATAPQPATKFVNCSFDPPMWFGFGAHRAIYCGKCRRRRWAAHMVVYVYFDQMSFYCAPGRGCKVKRKRKRSKG